MKKVPWPDVVLLAALGAVLVYAGLRNDAGWLQGLGALFIGLALASLLVGFSPLLYLRKFIKGARL